MLYSLFRNVKQVQLGLIFIKMGREDVSDFSHKEAHLAGASIETVTKVTSV